MVEGLEAGLTQKSVQRFFLDKQGRPYSLDGGDLSSSPDKFETLVAVGPEALRYLQPRCGNVPLFYAMVLNPEKIFDPQCPIPCGVSLNIPVHDLLSAIIQTFPAMTSLGVLFDPANNQAWYNEANHEAEQLGLELVPLQVNRRKGKLAMQGDFNLPDGVLFIPDKSIISKAIIQYVITQSALRKVPAIGYNQFFYASGAALTLQINYYAVGQQVAQLIEQHRVADNCSIAFPPAFDIRVNTKILHSLQHN
jgi:putative ABC transport system substrate-binding protein